MINKDNLELYLKGLKIEDPKYELPNSFKNDIASIADQISNLEAFVYIKPNDPWMLSGDALIRMPDTPTGKGLTMEVNALTVINALGGNLLLDHSTGNFLAVKKNYKLKENQSFINNLKSMKMPLSEILIPLELGVVLSNDGSVFIADRSILSKLDPPNLNDDLRVILYPFADEKIFRQDLVEDEFGFKRHRYSQTLAIKSLSLSKSSYNMRIKQIIMDGWLDFNLIYEGEIKSTESDWITKPTPGDQFISTIRQLIATQSTKAVVMGRPTSDGKAIINITFTGTKHATDWLNNFKVAITNNVHTGFYELADLFDKLTPKIKLDRLANALGLKELTLEQALKEGAKKDSKFKFWITGHSQGGALTQIYIAEFMLKRGIPPENIWGYSFASPTVVTSDYTDNPADFPVYNIINTDDFAVRVGSMVRLGLDMVYIPDEDFRNENYKDYKDPKIKPMYKDIMNLIYYLTDSFIFGEFMSALASYATLFPVANKYISTKMLQMLEKPYKDAKGRAPSNENVEKIKEYLNVLYEKWGSDCLSKYMLATHQIPMNYFQIVLSDVSKFKKCIFNTDVPAKLLTLTGQDIMKAKDFPTITR